MTTPDSNCLYDRLGGRGRGGAPGARTDEKHANGDLRVAERRERREPGVGVREVLLGRWL